MANMTVQEVAYPITNKYTFATAFSGGIPIWSSDARSSSMCAYLTLLDVVGASMNCDLGLWEPIWWLTMGRRASSSMLREHQQTNRASATLAVAGLRRSSPLLMVVVR